MICRIAAFDEDWRAIHALLKAAFAFMDDRIDPPSSLHAMTPEDLQAAAARGPAFIAVMDGAPVGCAFGAVRGDALYIGKVAVDGRRRGAGVARALTDLARWDARRRGLARLELETRIELVENHAAFARLGFAKIAETAHPGYDRPTSITMSAPVGTPPAPGFLRHADADEDARRETLLRIIRASAPFMAQLEAARSLGLNQWRIVSGALYGMVWNRLTGRPDFRGVRDVDLIYWDDDVSWDAEDAVIRRALAAAPPGPPVEARNQARTPLWYESRFGAPYPPLADADQSLRRYASRNHAVGARLERDGTIGIAAPFGLADLFGFRIAPNDVLPNERTHTEKATRAQTMWPETEAAPWPGGQPPVSSAAP